MPDCPVPTGFSLTKNFYPDYKKIILACEKMFNKKILYKKIEKQLHDVPDKEYLGPF